MDKDKLKEYIDLCVPTFLIKMKTKNDKSYFFKAYHSGFQEEDGVLRFTIADVDPPSDETTHNWREINLNNEFDDLKSLKAVIIPEHKDMYKDIVTDEMKVDCGKDNCGGDFQQKPHANIGIPPAPTQKLKGLINKHNIGFKRTIPAPSIKELAPNMPSPNISVNLEKELANQKKIEEQRESAPITRQDTKEGGFEDTTEQEGGRKKKKKRRKKRSRSKKRRNKRKNRTKKN